MPSMKAGCGQGCPGRRAPVCQGSALCRARAVLQGLRGRLQVDLTDDRPVHRGASGGRSLWPGGLCPFMGQGGRGWASPCQAVSAA